MQVKLSEQSMLKTALTQPELVLAGLERFWAFVQAGKLMKYTFLPYTLKIDAYCVYIKNI